MLVQMLYVQFISQTEIAAALSLTLLVTLVRITVFCALDMEARKNNLVYPLVR